MVTLLELRLVGSKPFVALTFHPIHSAEAAASKLKAETTNTSHDFIDGILFSEERGVIMTGHLTDVQNSFPVVRFSRATDQWFYLHAEKVFADPMVNKTILIPIVDYLFRYDRGAFFVGAICFAYFRVPFNRVTRWALDFFMHTRVMMNAVHESKLSDRYIVQDIAVPCPEVPSFLSSIHALVKIFPLWLCPLRKLQDEQTSMHSRKWASVAQNEITVNIGIWGFGSNSPEEFVRLNREIESITQQHRAEKCLYAHTYYTEKEFWETYDRAWYEELREKYKAKTLLSVYDKVVVDTEAQKKSFNGIWRVWPLRALYGAGKAALGSEYTLASEGRTLWMLLVVLSGGTLLIVKYLYSTLFRTQRHSHHNQKEAQH